MYQDLGQIIGPAQKVPFTRPEMVKATDAVKGRQSRGTDLAIGHPLYTAEFSDFMEAANDGVFFMHSPRQLETGFLFVKLDAGRSLFGSQKAVFASYIGSVMHEDQWMAGATFKSWMIALTSMGNVYRSEGYR